MPLEEDSSRSEKAGMELPDKFPWIGLFETMAKQGVCIKNYPDDVPLPNAAPRKGKSKGIDNLVKPEKLQLINCLINEEMPMQFCKGSADGKLHSHVPNMSRKVCIDISSGAVPILTFRSGKTVFLKDRPAPSSKKRLRQGGQVKSENFIVSEEDDAELSNEEYKYDNNDNDFIPSPRKTQASKASAKVDKAEVRKGKAKAKGKAVVKEEDSAEASTPSESHPKQTVTLTNPFKNPVANAPLQPTPPCPRVPPSVAVAQSYQLLRILQCSLRSPLCLSLKTSPQ